jgi:hypothetical protein
MIVANSEREVGYSVMEYSSCASREIVMLPAGRHGVRGVSAVATPFGLASEAALHGWRPLSARRNPTSLSL